MVPGMSTLSRRDDFRKITVAQGEARVSGDADVVLTTILGSCVACCFYDPVERVGGLNHYLLAAGSDHAPGNLQRYGIHAMEVLINEMLKRGAMRHRLKARIFGGARMHSAFKDIGKSNIDFARTFLRDEKIPLVGEDVGGFSARRVEFRAGLGMARCRTVTGAGPPTVVNTPVAKPTPASEGDVEFF